MTTFAIIGMAFVVTLLGLMAIVATNYWLDRRKLLSNDEAVDTMVATARRYMGKQKIARVDAWWQPWSLMDRLLRPLKIRLVAEKMGMSTSDLAGYFNSGTDTTQYRS